MPSLPIAVLAVAVLVAACGPDTNDDSDTGNEGSASGPPSSSTGSTGSISATGSPGSTGGPSPTTGALDSESGASTAAPVDCAMVDPGACNGTPGCIATRGGEATPTGVEGEYSCSDAVEPFGCMPSDCEPFEGIVCGTMPPVSTRWIFEGCIPLGWEPCPGDPVCT